MSSLNLPPSRAVGEIKNAIREAVLDGLVENNHDAAFAYMMEIKDQILAGIPESYFRAT
jgi:poly(A) polymerase